MRGAKLNALTGWKADSEIQRKACLSESWKKNAREFNNTTRNARFYNKIIQYYADSWVRFEYPPEKEKEEWFLPRGWNQIPLKYAFLSNLMDIYGKMQRKDRAASYVTQRNM